MRNTLIYTYNFMNLLINIPNKFMFLHQFLWLCYKNLICITFLRIVTYNFT